MKKARRLKALLINIGLVVMTATVAASGPLPPGGCETTTATPDTTKIFDDATLTDDACKCLSGGLYCGFIRLEAVTVLETSIQEQFNTKCKSACSKDFWEEDKGVFLTRCTAKVPVKVTEFGANCIDDPTNPAIRAKESGSGKVTGCPCDG